MTYTSMKIKKIAWRIFIIGVILFIVTMITLAVNLLVLRVRWNSFSTDFAAAIYSSRSELTLRSAQPDGDVRVSDRNITTVYNQIEKANPTSWFKPSDIVGELHLFFGDGSELVAYGTPEDRIYMKFTCSDGEYSFMLSQNVRFSTLCRASSLNSYIEGNLPWDAPFGADAE